MPDIDNNTVISEVQYNAITEFSKTLEMFSLTPSEARLFVTLYIEGKPMTLDEMSEALAKSKTSMSTGIRTLVDLNLVERVWKKGVRKDLYQANENLFQKFMSSYVHRWLDAASRQKESLEETKAMLDEEAENQNQTCVKDLQSRLDDMIEFHTMVTKAFEEINP
ncbi:GbsR/MarR family transcriptional regulator [Pontibacillus salicampi]|uniref:HTH-type transcriptional regulator n=1 Tax=Pontibacillus salicampi TaxID=1449801 RepID=A0ABV6LM55_9BACI